MIDESEALKFCQRTLELINHLMFAKLFPSWERAEIWLTGKKTFFLNLDFPYLSTMFLPEISSGYLLDVSFVIIKEYVP